MAAYPDGGMDLNRCRWLNDRATRKRPDCPHDRHSFSHAPSPLSAAAHAASPKRRPGVAAEPGSPCGSPSRLLVDDGVYAGWRAARLARLGSVPLPPVVPVKDPFHLSPGEIAAMRDSVRRHNLFLYGLDRRGDGGGPDPDDDALLHALCRQVGLTDALPNPASDRSGVSRIEAVEPGRPRAGGRQRARYIPYTRERLDWHTDGYYSPAGARVRAFALHCVRSALDGGENRLLDPELLYILLRDHSPRLARALSHPEAFLIPADDGRSGSGRREFRGPVFSIDRETGTLYTRFTRRRRNIFWREDADTREAVAFVGALLDGPHPAILRRTLLPGQGIVCNNVLHCRTAFRDRTGSGNGRLLHRLRFRQRIAVH